MHFVNDEMTDAFQVSIAHQAPQQDPDRHELQTGAGRDLSRHLNDVDIMESGKHLRLESNAVTNTVPDTAFTTLLCNAICEANGTDPARLRANDMRLAAFASFYIDGVKFMKNHIRFRDENGIKYRWRHQEGTKEPASTCHFRSRPRSPQQDSS